MIPVGKSTRRPLDVFSFYERSCYVHMCTHTELGINDEFVIHGRLKTEQLSLHKGWAKWSWTTDSVALNITVQFVIYSAPD